MPPAKTVRGLQAESDGGWVIVADVTDFPMSEHMSGALVKLNAGGMRQLHWHTDQDEWRYVINSTIQVPSYPPVQAGT
jgi:oxalate decarboxylase/phosphoglucose isomerase-like protein (cupin superfamily)